MSKRKIIILYTLTSLVFVLSIMAIFGAFLFDEKVSVTTTLGNITSINKGFVTYAPGTVTDNVYTGISNDLGDYEDLEDYQAKLSERKTAKTINASSIICYASEKEGNDEENPNYFYLNQLGLQFSIAATIDVYIRIHFEDAWILEKTIGGNTMDPQYVRKNAIGSENYPFKPVASDENSDEDNPSSTDYWYYESSRNNLYYKQKIVAAATTHSFAFDLNPEYFYEKETEENTSLVGHEAILVEVSFTVDVVQANRAYKIWGLDPSTL